MKTITGGYFRKLNETKFKEKIYKTISLYVCFEKEAFNRDQENNCDQMPLFILNNKITVFENLFSDVYDKHAPYREVIVKKPTNP